MHVDPIIRDAVDMDALVAFSRTPPGLSSPNDMDCCVLEKLNRNFPAAVDGRLLAGVVLGNGNGSDFLCFCYFELIQARHKILVIGRKKSCHPLSSLKQRQQRAWGDPLICQNHAFFPCLLKKKAGRRQPDRMFDARVWLSLESLMCRLEPACFLLRKSR